jgi:alpha/beta hydrolase fold
MSTSITGERNWILYKTTKVDNLDIFYRKAGSREAPTIVLLHGFPTSSHMFRNLIMRLSDKFHLVALDYPGFGNSSAPPADAFDHLAAIIEKFIQDLQLKRFSIYLQEFPADGAHPYKRDLKKIDFHLLDTGHFALEEDYGLIAELISNFHSRIRSMQAQGVA